MPTDQLIKAYLEKEDFRFVRTTYFKIGRAIVDFSNHYLQHWDRVTLIKPHGPQKERATTAMATPVVKALGEHVMRKVKAFRPYNATFSDQESRITAAKYLGK